MNILSNYGEKLEELIFESKKSSKELASIVGVDYSEMQRYLRKEVMPSLNKVIAIADYFDCSIDYMLGLSEESGSLFKKAPLFYVSFRKILEGKGCTRYNLEKVTNIAHQSIIDWYNGKRVPSIDNVIKLAKYFDCTIDYLLGRE